MLAVEITTIAELGTAAGTLVLAIATFASVRSANRTAQIAERSLRVGLRPLLVQPRAEDPGEPVMFPEGVKLDISGGLGDMKLKDDAVYMAVPIRNVGLGMAVLHGWYLTAGWFRRADEGHPDPDDFRQQLRDLYIPPGDTGFWQGAIRDPEDRFHADAVSAVGGDEDGLSLFLMYGDYEGGQRMVCRFGMRQTKDGRWLPTVGRHWSLDGADVRPPPPPEAWPFRGDSEPSAG